MCCYTACSNEDLPEVPVYETVAPDIIESDPLIVNLKMLNDSLILESQLKYMTADSRGFLDWLKGIGKGFSRWFRKSVTIIVADLKGGLAGGSFGFTVGGPLGASIGGVIVGAGYSAEVWHKTDAGKTMNNPGGLKPIELEKLELALSNARLDGGLVENERNLNDNVSIKIPRMYADCYEVGLYHNVCLRQIVENKLDNQEIRKDAFSASELNFLESEDFKNFFFTSIRQPQNYDIDYICEDPSKSERIIQLFIQALEEYPQEFDDINLLIDNYIELIENDGRITDEEKRVVYSTLSTAAFSASFWYEKLKDEDDEE